MYFLTYEYIKKKVADSVPADQTISETRKIAGTVLAGGMGEFRV